MCKKEVVHERSTTMILHVCLTLLIGAMAPLSLLLVGIFWQMLIDQQKDWSRGVSNGWRKSRLEEVIASGEWEDAPWDLQFELLYDLPSSCVVHGEEAEKCGRMGHMAWTGWGVKS